MKYFHFLVTPGNIRDRHDHILQLLDMHCNSDGSSAKDGDVNTGYLVLLNHESSERASVAWGGDTIHVKPTAETTISLSQIEVRYLKKMN